LVKVTGKGQITIPPAMRKKHGLSPKSEVTLVDRPDGILVTKAAKLLGGTRVLAALLRGGKIPGRTKEWLKLTRA
jgi:AbrB family looped-hinge helix DNA binding protein